MGLFRFLLTHRLFVHYLSIIIVVVGIMCFMELQREARPNVNFNRVAVAIAYPGASPSDIEELLISPIEEKLAEIDGIEEYRSISYSGAGAVAITIDDEYPDQEEIADEVRRKVAEVSTFPEEATDPFVTEVKAANIPVIRFAIFGEIPPEQFKTEVEQLKDYLTRFDGVQSVSYTGLTDLQLKIVSHPEKLTAYDVTLMEMIGGLRQWAKKRPGGLLENKTLVADILVGREYNDKESLKDFVIRSNDALRSIKISDVADVEFGLQKASKKNLFQGKPAVLVTVTKKPFADAVEVADEINLALEEYKTNLNQELSLEVYRDEAIRVKDRLGTVLVNAVFGLTLVLILLILFLDWRAAMVTTLGIPVAMLGGIVIIYFTGNTLNTLVLVGMIIVLGMLVDDAIVVCENIYSYIEKGLSPTEAAIKGAYEMAVPVSATVLTTMFAFLPILFMKEIMGQFLRVIPITVMAMLAISLIEALFILPVHASEIMRAKVKKRSIFSKVEDIYARYLEFSIDKKYFVLLFVVLMFVGTAFQGKNLFENFTLFPAKGLNGMGVRVELPKNSPLEATSDSISGLSKRLEAVSEGSFESISSAIGEVRTGGNGGSRQNASNLGSINVSFVSDSSFLEKEKRIVSNIRKEAKKWSQETGNKASITIDRPGPPIGKPIQFQVTSRDFTIGSKVIEEIKENLLKLEGVHSIETDLDGDTVSYSFEIDGLLAASLGVQPENISQTIYAATTGVIANEVVINSEKVDLLVGLKSSDSRTVNDILNLRVPNQLGNSIPIKSFAKVVETKTPSSIQRLNGLRTITIYGEVDEKLISGKLANQKMRPKIKEITSKNPTVSIETGGGEKDRMNALSDTMRLYVLAIIVVFMTISLAFKSILFPFLVLLAIPFGLVGVVWSLTLHNMPLSLMGFIGLVGLSGVVVNVSIILLKLLQDKLKEGDDYQEALVQSAVRRLRPIVITTITTLVGLIPLIYGIGGVDTFVQPLALVLGWGLFGATAMNVLVLPAVMACLPWVEKYSR